MKKRKGINFNIHISNRVAYTLIAFLMLAIVGVGVYAYGTSNPQTFGHSVGEIEGIPPSGAIMFFDLSSCPTGWTELTTAGGRYIVGKPSGGTLGAIVGTALTNSENRAVGQHTHTFTGNALPVHSHTVPSGYKANSQHGLYQNQGNSAGGTSSVSAGTPSGTNADAGSVAGTNAPYIQYLVCKKN